ncbi:hypothetical protein ALNOE001_03530 [Candidatus Methanobinarius endosymbioticus]|uniref:PRC-barrel domain-containing protein n=1 Tax=Candidatus Methanobinarius endosymbioticus TaxID=2006182 RepID=A0A366MDB0_9EURY|nr:hypothetical protein ALNOE001_03530 [Candidatus Methanobinarius endosymbioticus]
MDYGEKMVEVSNLYDLDIYTIAGQYVGRVVDVVLNIRMGTLSKLQVKALEPENKNVGIRDIFRNGLQFVPEENEMRAFQEGVLNVDFDKVRAIGDIMLIDPQDIQRQVPKTPQNQPQAQVSNQDPQNPM